MIDPNKLMRSVILALAVLLAAPVAGAALPILGVGQAEAATVSRIVVSGNHQVDADTVDSIIPLKVGQPATPGLISQSIDALYKTGLFSSVSVTQSGGTVFVRVAENPSIASVLYFAATASRAALPSCWPSARSDKKRAIARASVSTSSF